MTNKELDIAAIATKYKRDNMKKVNKIIEIMEWVYYELVAIY